MREDKLTLEKVISMARVSEASKEQVKAMGTKEQNYEIMNFKIDSGADCNVIS